MKKQILFVIDSLTCGGAEKSLVTLLPLLDYDKMDIDLLIVRRGGIFEQYLPQRVRIITLPSINGIRTLLQSVCRLRFSLWLRCCRLFGLQRHNAEGYWRAMKPVTKPLRKHYDVAVAYQQGFPTYYVAAKVKAYKKYAWVNIDLDKAGYTPSFNRPFYDCFDGIAAVSEVLHKRLANTLYVDKTILCTVYDILHSDIIGHMALEKGFTDELPSGTLRIVTAGRMSAQKNYTLAVQSANRLKDIGLPFRWYFVGDGEARGAVEQLIADFGLEKHVLLLGMQPNPYPYIAGCDIYVQTSSFEGYCLTLREARLLNKAVVSTNFSVVYDQIRDGENGLIAEMTAESVTEKIMLLAENAELRAKLIAETRLENDMTAETESEKVNNMLLQ